MPPSVITEKLSNKLSNMALICSFFVVFIHTGTECADGDSTWWIMHMIKDGICRIAVPFFFLAAGFFLAGHCYESGWWVKECKKRIYTLLIPYILWCSVYFIYSMCFTLGANVHSGAVLTRNMPLTVFELLNIYGLTFGKFPYYIPLWFVRWLMILMIVSWLCFRIIKHSKLCGKIYLVILWLLWCFLSPKFAAHENLQIFSFSGLFFFNLGIYLRLWRPKIHLATYQYIILFFIGMSCFAVVNYGRLHEIQWSGYFSKIAIPLVLLATWNFVSANKWNKFLTACSFPIYLLHMFVLASLNIIKKNIPGLPYPSGISEYLLNGVIAIIGSIIITFLLRKYLPKLSCILFGGR